MPQTIAYCPSCGVDLSPQALSCPGCQQLVHAAKLEELSRLAKAKEAASAPTDAAAFWTQMLPLLPPESKQAAAIRDRIAALGANARTAANQSTKPKWLRQLGAVGTAIAAFWAKFKFLLLGLLKFKTLFSMLASIGYYWLIFGWRFGIGVVIGIYIHEMGHVWALNRFGMRASAPMFIPGLGAFISLYQSPENVNQDARIGIAGPIWGAAAALMFLMVSFVSPGSGIWMALAHFTAYMNMFNLTPVWQLDGGRSFRALDRQQRIMLGVLLLLLFAVTHEGMLLILTIGAAYRIFWSKDAAPSPDWPIFLQYAGLVALFSAMIAAISANH